MHDVKCVFWIKKRFQGHIWRRPSYSGLNCFLRYVLLCILCICCADVPCDSLWEGYIYYVMFSDLIDLYVCLEKLLIVFCGKQSETLSSTTEFFIWLCISDSFQLPPPARSGIIGWHLYQFFWPRCPKPSPNFLLISAGYGLHCPKSLPSGAVSALPCLIQIWHSKPLWVLVTFPPPQSSPTKASFLKHPKTNVLMTLYGRRWWVGDFPCTAKSLQLSTWLPSRVLRPYGHQRAFLFFPHLIYKLASFIHPKLLDYTLLSPHFRSKNLTFLFSL